MSDAIDRLRAALADRYTIEKGIGEGGMATVYLAEDIKHHRKVAIKLLKPELAAVLGAERFVQEIETTAALQHPHILPLFDSGTADGFLYYVMPFIDGETLRDKLDRETQLGIEEAVQIAREVADALDYAHRHGVIHRDIKPENILLHDGRPMVADFGIALAVSAAAGGRMTETGLSLGTPHYMSPEQATAEKEIDARSDVYSIGSVLYEMLTGNPPHVGSSAQQIIMRIVTEDAAPVNTVRRAVPNNVAAAVGKSIEKLPADRFESAKAFAEALANPAFTTVALSSATGRGSSAISSRVVTALGVGLALMTAVAAWALMRGATEDSGPSVYDLALPDSAAVAFTGQNPFTPYGTPFRSLSVASSGAFVVYLAREGETTVLWRRSLTDGTTARIDGTLGALMPRVSPDERRLAFASEGQLRILPLDGGAIRQLGTLIDPALIEWAGADRLLVVEEGGRLLRTFDPEGGELSSKPVVRCTQGQWIDPTRLLCGSAGVAVLVDPETGEGDPILGPGADGSTRPVVGSEFRMFDDRYLVFASLDGELRAAPYDQATNQIGRSVTLLQGVRRESIGDAQFDLTEAGGLIFAPGDNAEVGRLVRMGPDGAITPLAIEPRPYRLFELSRDGRWLAAVVQSSGVEALEVTDLQNGRTFRWLESEVIGSPFWDSAGETIMVTLREGEQRLLLRGSPFSSSAPDTLFGDEGTRLALNDWPDDSTAFGYVNDDWAVVQLDPRTKPVTFDTLATDRIWITRSPNRRHLILWSRDGRAFVTNNPPNDEQHLIASNAVEPLWLDDGQVVYRSGDAWYVQAIDAATGRPVGSRRIMGTDPRFADTFGWSNRPSRDGGIIYKQGPANISAGYLRVIPNWVEQMKRVVDEANR